MLKRILKGTVLLIVLLGALALLYAWRRDSTELASYRQIPLPDTSAEAEPLRWLDHADVIADFTERVEHQHDYRFVSVFAFNRTGALGLRDTLEVQELLRRHGERHLEGTTDIITSAEQQRLLGAASTYARQYNILLLHYFREHPDI